MNQAVDKPFYLRDNFAPVFEEVTEDSLEVVGNIPPELNGRLLRNGPNPQTGWADHWFFGNGMVHGVEFENGKRVYHAGDTCPFMDMKLIAQCWSPQVCILPIGDHFTMGARGAALAAKVSGPCVLASRYDDSLAGV